MPYSNDDDLLEIRSNILSLGVTSWTDKHVAAQTEIDRSLETR